MCEPRQARRTRGDGRQTAVLLARRVDAQLHVGWRRRNGSAECSYKIKRTGVVSDGQALGLARAAIAADGLRFVRPDPPRRRRPWCDGPITYPSTSATAGFVACAPPSSAGRSRSGGDGRRHEELIHQ
jgi:hypothetical protein